VGVWGVKTVGGGGRKSAGGGERGGRVALESAVRTERGVKKKERRT